MFDSRLLLIAAAAAALAGCDGDHSVRITTNHSETSKRGVLKVVDALQCPDTQGGLTRKGPVGSDGALCRYGGPKGAEVTLHLISLDGATAADTLLAFEERLGRDLPDAARKVQAQAVETAPAMSDGGDADTAHVRAPGIQVDAHEDQASVRLPGLRVEADGDRASVRIGGLHIRADDHGQTTQAATGTATAPGAASTREDGVSINSRDDATEVRTSAGGDATRVTYILTNNQASAAGWRMVAYEARGPAGGPLVVATVRAKGEHDDSVLRDAKRLVRLNVGD